MKCLLFLCKTNDVGSPMAAYFAKLRAPDDLSVMSAGIEPAKKVDPLVKEVMAEKGAEMEDHKPKALSQIPLHRIDAIVTLCPDAVKECKPQLPGYPPTVSWHFEDPFQGVKGDAAKKAALRKLRDAIEAQVDVLFKQGYLATMIQNRSEVQLILDSLMEGVLVHDLDRRIIFFNRTAERITGILRDQVLGRDCHEVFPGHFCRRECSFCDGTAPLLDSKVYPVQYLDPDGEEHYLEMSVRAIVKEDQQPIGVIASFRDLTREKTLARRLGEIEQFNGIIGRDQKMLEVFDLIRSVADSNVPALIQGESGTGKELVAAAIHNESPRHDKLFVPVNCGALPEGLLESELFGHVRGAFTGAVRDKKGRFELAHEGTIFLDEIGDISQAMQVKLLRVLQEGTFERVGSTQTMHVDVRVISATNKDLKAEIAAGRFRDDLFYRLCVVPILLPPLRERRSDIPLLIDHFLARRAAKESKDKVDVSPAAVDAMLSYDWPGNVRELQNALQFALVKSRGEAVEVNHLPPNLLRNISHQGFAFVERPAPLTRGRKRKLTRAAVKEALEKTDGNKAEAARYLGVGRATLYRFLTREGFSMES